MNKLDILERALWLLIEPESTALEISIDRRLGDRRLNIERRWAGQSRWIYVTAIDDLDLTADYFGDYVLFLGWYSDPPGKVHAEFRRMANLIDAQRLVSLWMIEGAPPEVLDTLVGDRGSAERSEWPITS